MFGCRVLIITALAAPAVVPLTAAAVDADAFTAQTRTDNFVELGLGYVSDESARFGRYNALDRDGFFAVLGLSYLQRAAWDADTPDYLAVRVDEAGLGNRRAHLGFGRQGLYGVQFDYRERRARWGNDRVTVYQPGANNELGLPADWQPAQTTAGMSQLLPALHEFNLHQNRREVSAAGHVRPAERWRVTSQVRQEDRDGQRTLAGLFGNSGGTPRAAFLPVPIDYRTRHIDLGLDYNNRRQQFRLAYHGSLFNNNQASVRFANPYSTIGGWAPGSGHPDGVGQLALAPDNQFHQLSAAGAWQFRPSLRGLAEVAIGRMTQDEAFLPLTANPILAESIVQDLPASSLDGRIDTTVLNLRLTGTRGNQFQWNASYRFDDRDQRTERREFVYIGGDSQQQDAGESSSRRRYNPLYDYRNQRLRLDGQWRLPDRTRLTAAIERERIERSDSARERTDEDRLELRAQRAFGQRVQLGGRLRWADRTGSNYDGSLGFLATHDPGYTDTLAGQWANLPALRQFHLADRRREQFALNLQLLPHEHWTLGLEAAWMDDDYRRSEIGLSESSIRNWTAHLAYTPDRRWSGHAFFAWERLDSEQLGLSFRGGANRLPDIADPERRWQVDHRDRVDTAGVGVQRNWMDGRLELAADYVLARARSRIDVSTGSALTSAPLPTIRNRLNSVMLRSSYQINPSLSLHARYWRESFRSADWAIDDVAVNQLANVILPGDANPDYSVNVVSLAARYRF